MISMKILLLRLRKRKGRERRQEKEKWKENKGGIKVGKKRRRGRKKDGNQKVNNSFLNHKISLIKNIV